jgi:predicted dehydrogenase
MQRRTFSSAAAMTALSYSRILGANGRLQMGYIGVGNRGDQVHDGFLEHGDQVTVALCDLKTAYMDFATKKSRATPKQYSDYRKLLDDKNVEAVAIATPDHWHALMFIDACKAGKDVYVEKPLSLTVVEGRRMVQVADETKRVTQVGIHRRSGKFLQEAAQFCREGGLGKITLAQGFHLSNEWPNGLGAAENENPIPEAEWDQWLGPAPKVPYHRNRTYYNFRWFYNYSGGQLTNFGVHYMDMLRWCIGQDSPRSVTVMGGRYGDIKDNREIPDTLQAMWEFDGCMVIFTQSNANASPMAPGGPEMVIRGTKGTMLLWGNRWEVVPEKVTEQLFGYRTPLDRTAERGYNPSKKETIAPKSAKGSADTAFHARNFLDCVKSRQKCNCDILTGHLSTSATLIGNIALKTRSYLEWDAKAEKFTNNAAANKLLHYAYRPPYKLG